MLSVPQYDFTTGKPLQEEPKETAVCENYFKDKTNSKNLGTLISFIIIGVNTILKNVIIALITWIGEDTVSEQLSSITNGVFYA
jgi:hypothetical protein